MMHEKATMVRSKAMMTQRGRIFRLRIVFVSTVKDFLISCLAQESVLHPMQLPGTAGFQYP